MAKATEMTGATKVPSETIDYAAILQTNGAALDAVIKASDAVMRGMAQLSQEVVDFTNERLRESIETSQTLMGCRDAGQAFGLQCDFARKATQQYLEEANKLMRLAADITRESWAPFETRTRETLERLNAR